MLKLEAGAVIFDMDGVITDSMPYHYRAWKKIFKDAGLCVSEREIYLREGQPGNVTIREIYKERRISYDPNFARKMLFAKEIFFKKIFRRRFVSGSRSYIRHLRSCGLSLALVTGTARHEVEEVMPLSLRNFFDVIVTGDEVEHGKPHPEPFLRALKKLKIKPQEALVIENAPFGITSAKRAGLRCLALETSLPRVFLSQADMVFSSFNKLRRGVKIFTFQRKCPA